MKHVPLSRWYLIGICVIVTLPILNPLPAFLHVPIWFLPASWGKVLVFRVLVSLLALLSLYLLLFRSSQLFSRERFRILCKTPLFLATSSFLGVFLVATLFSQDISLSIWGDPNRGGGILNLLFYGFFAFGATLFLKEKDWETIWKVAAFTGGLVMLIAFFQWQGWFSNIFTQESRPFSTLGSPIFLAMYLLLLIFPTFSIGVRQARFLHKAIYIALASMLFFGVILALTRAAFLGFIVATLLYTTLYPYQDAFFKKGARFLAITGIVGGLFLFVFLNTNQERLLRIYFVGDLAQRISIEQTLTDARFSGWQIAWQALLYKPALGYGPENFSVGFDRFYDSTIPGINDIAASWWDRAHNIFLDIGTQVGIIGMIIYAFLIGFLFRTLQSLKKKFPAHAVFLLGLQASLTGYVVANFFSFDVFSTYLIFFLIIAYALSLSTNKEQDTTTQSKQPPLWIKSWRIPLITIGAICILWFLWSANLKPLHINATINKAHALGAQHGCQEAIATLHPLSEENLGFLQSYFSLQYANWLSRCARDLPNQQLDFTTEAYRVAKETTEFRPTFTRAWIGWGAHATSLLQYKQQGFLQELTEQQVEALRQEAEYAFQQAHALSPKRPEVYTEWGQFYLTQQKYAAAQEKAYECIQIAPTSGSCWWHLALAEIPHDNKQQAKEHIQQAAELEFETNSIPALHQLTNAYVVIPDFQELKIIAKKLIQKNPSQLQYHIALATAQRELGEYAQARRTAQEALRILPQTKEEIENFLRTLP